MSGRLLSRKWGRDLASISAQSTTHVIKIGWDAREPKAQRPVPGKYNGFVICRDRLGNDGQLVTDDACMARLLSGWKPEHLAAARRDGMKAPDALLPKTLRFILLRDAIRDGGEYWRYPDTAHEALECWDTSGLFCFGDGVNAKRRDPQIPGGRFPMDCNPVGKPGIPAASTCPKSADGSCKQHLRVLLCLWIAGPNGQPEPLCRELGWDARFRLDTSSGYAGLRLISALDAASDRVRGQIRWLTGAVSFAVQKKRHAAGVGLTQQIMFALSEHDLQKREAYLRAQAGMVISTDATATSRQLTADPTATATAGNAPQATPAPSPAMSAPEALAAHVDPAERPLSVDERVCMADPGHLIAVLQGAAALVASRDALSDEHAWSSVVTFDMGNGRKWTPDSPGWFLDGETDAKRAVRLDILQALAVKALGAFPQLLTEIDNGGVDQEPTGADIPAQEELGF